MQNNLANQNSLYLRQHAKNPVHWQPWDEETLALAKELDKPLIISIGYSACHWCHVMESNVFEHDDVAKIMNENFVCVKVDREERPDVDQVYMDAIQLINGNGGWPLNVFALPDGKPFFGGTYFPKDKWIALCRQIVDIKKNKLDSLLETANSIYQKLVDSESVVSENDELIDEESLVNSFASKWSQSYDAEFGGEKGAPKFPMSPKLSALWNYGSEKTHPELQKQTVFTLRKIIAGGIYDQVGGGFSRYSVDQHWHVPHFEKMLYDNAQFLSVIAKVAAIDKHWVWSQVLNETFDWLKREMYLPEGFYASAIDADSDGVEGKFYVWKYDEFAENVDTDFWTTFYNVQPKGNWESVNVLNYESEWLDNHKTIINDVPSFEYSLKELKNRLQNVRSKRVRPATDGKAITAWNALLASGFLDVHIYLGDERFLNAGLDLSEKLKGEWMRNTDFSRILNYESASGMLEDYAYAAQCFYRAFVATGEFHWLKLSEEVFESLIVRFKRLDRHLFNFYALNQQLFVKKTEWMDTIMPSANAVIARLADDLGYFLDKPEYTALADNMFNEMYGNMLRFPLYTGAWHEAYLQRKTKLFIKASSTYSHQVLRQAFALKGLYPDIKISNDIQVRQIVLCKGRSCFAPVDSIGAAVGLCEPDS